MTRSDPTRPRALAAWAAAIVVAFSLMTVSVPASAEPVAICVGDECDNGLWKAARGEANEISYWGANPGHNCTNYVAWRLIGDGVEQPPTRPGNANTWAERAITDGFLVDSVPEVGAVAQWDAFQGGAGFAGHVAYVEELLGDGMIRISEDHWPSGDLTYRTVNVDSVSHFIHYRIDFAPWLRTVDSASGTQASTGLRTTPSALSAVNMGEPEPRLYYVEQGVIYEATAEQATWAVTSTGITTDNPSVSAVNMGGMTPQVMTVNATTLYLNVGTDGGWQRMSTGLTDISGPISAVDTGGLWPTVMLSQAGVLYEMWGDTEGWHVQSTGLEAWGAIGATIVNGWIEVYSLESGQLHRSWQDEAGWHDETTGIPLDTAALSASSAGGSPRIVAVEAGVIVEVSRDAEGWHKTSTGVEAGSLVTTVDMGGATPLVLQAG